MEWLLTNVWAFSTAQQRFLSRARRFSAPPSSGGSFWHCCVWAKKVSGDPSGAEECWCPSLPMARLLTIQYLCLLILSTALWVPILFGAARFFGSHAHVCRGSLFSNVGLDHQCLLIKITFLLVQSPFLVAVGPLVAGIIHPHGEIQLQHDSSKKPCDSISETGQYMDQEGPTPPLQHLAFLMLIKPIDS